MAGYAALIIGRVARVTLRQAEACWICVAIPCCVITVRSAVAVVVDAVVARNTRHLADRRIAAIVAVAYVLSPLTRAITTAVWIRRSTGIPLF